MNFSIENFRVLKGKHDFEFVPLNFLVGPNNAGKSTIFKTLKLIEFSRGESIYPKLNYFVDSKFKNDWNSLSTEGDKPIKVEFNIPWCEGVTLILKLSFVSDGLSEYKIISRTDYDSTLFFVDFIYSGFEETTSPEIVYGFNVFEFQRICKKKKKSELLLIQKHLNQLEKNKSNLADLGFDVSMKKIWIDRKNQLEKEIELLSLEVFKYSLEDNMIDLDELKLKEIRKIEKKVFKAGNNFEINEENHFYHLRLFEHFDEMEVNEMRWLLLLWYSLGANQLKKETALLHGNINISLTATHEFLVEKETELFSSTIKSYIEQFTKSYKISSQMKFGRNKYFMLNEESDHILTRIIQKFVQNDSKRQDFYRNYINFWLEKFGIGKGFEIKNINNDIVELLLLPDYPINKKINVIDMGFGVSQIISIIGLPLLYLDPNEAIFYLTPPHDAAPAQRGVEDTILVYLEEPESNLHPNWQSLLVELLFYQYKEFGFKFLIETHSECFIRKIQYEIARYYALGSSRTKHSISKDEVIIYYVNSDKYVDEESGETKVKTIKIDERGGLSDNFGSGFYDEAINLKFDLLKLNNYQSN